VIHGPGPGAWAGQASPPTTGAPRPLNRRRAEDLDGTRGTLLVGPAGGAVDGTDADFRGAHRALHPGGEGKVLPARLQLPSRRVFGTEWKLPLEV